MYICVGLMGSGSLKECVMQFKAQAGSALRSSGFLQRKTGTQQSVPKHRLIAGGGGGRELIFFVAKQCWCQMQQIFVS